MTTDAHAPCPPGFVGFADGSSDIAIFPERVPPYPYDSMESVFRHEVVHLALDARAGGAELPRWFHEGVAMSVDKGWGMEGRVRLLLAMARSPGTAELGRLFASRAEPEATQAYGLSGALVADLRRRHGATVPGAIAARVAGGTSFVPAFVSETGETPDSRRLTRLERLRPLDKLGAYAHERIGRVDTHPGPRRRRMAGAPPRPSALAPAMERRRPIDG